MDNENHQETPLRQKSSQTMVYRNMKRSCDMFVSDSGIYPHTPYDIISYKKKIKERLQYEPVLHLFKEKPKIKTPKHTTLLNKVEVKTDKALQVYKNSKKSSGSDGSKALMNIGSKSIFKKGAVTPKPRWHAPWKLSRVISGHQGWVRCVSVDPSNEWFVTGAADRTIKIWDLAKGTLKLTLTGHISAVRGVKVSEKFPYLFSCGEDKLVKCWDLEQNKVIRHYHGTLSACYAMDLHPTLDILATAGRDSVCRIWDIRTKANIMTLTGHTNTIADVKCQSAQPEVITGSHDCQIRLWDLAAGKTRSVLTNHKKSIRALALHPKQYTFVSGAPDNLKQWKFPDGTFLQNLSGHDSIINTLALNSEGVLVSGADNGTMHFWDWRTGYNFQRMQAAVQPGSLDSENAIFAMTFDKTEQRLITCEGDKTIKIYQPDDEATEESHPLNWKPEILRRKRF